MKNCSKCGALMADTAAQCPACGPKPDKQTPLGGLMRKNPWIAALLSCMVPGLGHYYAGAGEQGSRIMGGFLLSLFLIPFGIGMLIAPVLWIYGIISSYRAAIAFSALAASAQAPAPPSGTGGDSRTGKKPWLAALLAVVPGWGHIYAGAWLPGFVLFYMFMSCGIMVAPYGPRWVRLAILGLYLYFIFDSYLSAKSGFAIKSLGGALRGLLWISGPVVLAVLATRYGLVEFDRANIHYLRSLRSAVAQSRSDHGGALPPTLESLVPGYLGDIPATRGHHGTSAAVRNSPNRSFTDEGGWLYVTTDASVFVNCTHGSAARYNHW